MRAFKLVLEYDGTDFAGWQAQPEGRTVQQSVEAPLSTLLRHPVRIHGAGRTDAGVHALGQVAHLHTGAPITAERIRHSMNGMLPADISLREVAEVGLDFHARISAIGKRYRYRILHRRSRSALWGRYAWHVPFELDLQALDGCLALLVGEHDFAAFCAAGASTKTSVRTIHRAERVPEEGGLFTLEFEGSGFLRYQVRSMVGTAIDVAMGRGGPERVARLLREGRREEVGQTAPPQGLTLVEVLYPEQDEA